MKVVIELTDQQAYTMMEALEMYSRVGMGQFDNIEYTLSMDVFDPVVHRQEYDRELALSYLRQARSVIFGGLSGNAYKGIMQTSERSKISWDIYQQLRHHLTVYKHPDEPIETRGNAFQKPFVVSSEPLPKVTIRE